MAFMAESIALFIFLRFIILHSLKKRSMHCHAQTWYVFHLSVEYFCIYDLDLSLLLQIQEWFSFSSLSDPKQRTAKTASVKILLLVRGIVPDSFYQASEMCGMWI